MAAPFDLLDLLERQLDSGWGADPDSALTRGMLDRFRRCDLVVTAVVDFLASEDADGYWSTHYGCGEPGEDGDVAVARQRLAERLGQRLEADAKAKLEQAMQAAEKASERATKAESKAITEGVGRALAERALDDAMKWLSPIDQQRLITYHPTAVQAARDRRERAIPK